MVEVGKVIDGKYKLVRLLGDGGMGSVYEAEHLGLGTRVAIKVLHTDLARRSGLVERFLQEARVSAQIRSAHVVRVTDVDRTPEGVAYLVMELLEGEPLSNVIRRDRTLSVATATAYTSQILEALEAAHALGVVHRDLKPDNVFVTFEGGKPVLKLIDFGIAKLKRAEGEPGKSLTVAGMLMGTPEYMAPEQAYSAGEVDVRADLYSVGAMMYEMLSGKTPVSGEDPRVVVLKVERGEVAPLVQLVPGIPPEVAGFVHRAMAPRPELRFANATEMRLALDGVASGKRSNTAKLANVAGVPEVQALPKDAGSTVMGAPAPGALTPHAAGSNRPPPDAATAGGGGGGGTVRAAPIDARGPLPSPSYEAPTRSPPERKRSGTGLIVGLAALALFLGAGAVVAWVQMNPSTPATPEPLATTTTTTAPTAPTAPATPGTAVTVVTTTPPLTPPPPLLQPQPQPQHAPSGKPSASAPIPIPSNSADPAHPIPPIVLPSGFPSAIPLPSGSPSAIPGLPSGFPQFPFPPPQQQHQPSPPPNP